MKKIPIVMQLPICSQKSILVYYAILFSLPFGLFFSKAANDTAKIGTANTTNPRLFHVSTSYSYFVKMPSNSIRIIAATKSVIGAVTGLISDILKLRAKSEAPE